MNKQNMKNYIALFKTLGMSALLAVATPLFAAASYTQVTETFPPDPEDGQFFGFATAISDNVAVVGAWRGNTNGAAYVYVKTDAGWVFQQKLVASDAASQDIARVGGAQFGWAVAVAGDTIAVAAPRRVIGDGKNGAVYVFKRSETGPTWTEQAIITSRTSRAFALSVALQGQTLAVGALEDRSGPGTVDSGLAFVFKRSGDEWIEEASLMTSDIPDRNRWGVSVDISGSTVVVAAADGPGGGGPVYVFSRQGATWTQDATLSPGGNSVSLWGATLAAGGPGVSIYEHVGPDWQLRQTLPVGSGEQFVALREDRLLIGEHRTAGTGVAYVYGFDEETGQWTLNQLLSPTDGQAGDFFGIAVSLSSTAAIIGSPRHFHSPNPQSGAAYIYEP